MAAQIIMLNVVDYGAQGEYGLFGKTVCTSDVSTMTPEQIEVERAELREIYGAHVSILDVELVPAAR